MIERDRQKEDGPRSRQEANMNNIRYLCLLLLTVLAVVLPALGNVRNRRDVDDGTSDDPEAAEAESTATEAPGGCKEVQYPCTRMYSVQKPVKQCISYLCVTSVRRVYMVNKEICTKIMCKEDELIQEEKCRQLAGLPPRPAPEPQESPADRTEAN